MNSQHGNHYDLAALARQEMIAEGFVPDFPPEAQRQAAVLRTHPPLASPGAAVRDLRPKEKAKAITKGTKGVAGRRA